MTTESAVEQALVGLVLTRPQVLADVAAQITPADIGCGKLATIYTSAISLADAGRRVDVAAIKDSTGVDAAAVDAAVLGAGSRSGLDDYVRAIKQAARLRSIEQATRIAAHRTTCPDADADHITGELLDAISGHDVSDGPVRLGDQIKPAYMELQAAVGRDGARAGVPTGLIDYDSLTGGLVHGAMTVLAGRPGMGKTALAIDMLRGATKSGAHGLLVELEMGVVEVVTRMIIAEARVDSDTMMRGKGTIQDWQDVGRACEVLSNLPLYVWCPRKDVTPAALRAAVRRQSQRGQLDVVVLDYIGLMSLPRQRGQSREEVVSAASRDFKSMCTAHRVAGVLISQLNRGVESRPGKRPQLSDLRESGALEQDADVVTLVYRREYYEPQAAEHRGKAELIVAKHRNGPVGDVEAAWHARSSSFGNLAKQDDVQPCWR